jgi:hypothetical protein
VIAYRCLVSRSSARRPLVETLHGEDAALAAFSVWTGASRPFVHYRSAGRFVVTDGHTTVKVQVLSGA